MCKRLSKEDVKERSIAGFEPTTSCSRIAVTPNTVTPTTLRRLANCTSWAISGQSKLTPTTELSNFLPQKSFRWRIIIESIRMRNEPAAELIVHKNNNWPNETKVNKNSNRRCHFPQ